MSPPSPRNWNGSSWRVCGTCWTASEVRSSTCGSPPDRCRKISFRPTGKQPLNRLAGLRQDVLRGGYRLLEHGSDPRYFPGKNVLNIFTCGVMVVDALEAGRKLSQEGIFANVIVVTSPDLLFRGWQHANKLKMKNPGTRFTFHLESLIPASERHVPIVTVLDGHSHALSFIGSVFGSKALCLGVDEFGQSGQAEELYDHYQIGVKAISQACPSGDPVKSCPTAVSWLWGERRSRGWSG